MLRALAPFVLLAMLVPVVRAEEQEEKISAPGSSVEFAPQVEATAANQSQTLRLTGCALRTKARFRLYAIASYCDNPAEIETPEHLAAADRPKQLHLVMERRLPTRLVASAIESAIKANYPDQFQQQIKRVLAYLSEHAMAAGTNVRFTHLPGRGVVFRVNDAEPLYVDDVQFSRAVWDVYFGKHNLGDSIKRGLVSRISAQTAAE